MLAWFESSTWHVDAFNTIQKNIWGKCAQRVTKVCTKRDKSDRSGPTLGQVRSHFCHTFATLCAHFCHTMCTLCPDVYSKASTYQPTFKTFLVFFLFTVLLRFLVMWALSLYRPHIYNIRLIVFKRFKAVAKTYATVGGHNPAPLERFSGFRTPGGSAATPSANDLFFACVF